MWVINTDQDFARVEAILKLDQADQQTQLTPVVLKEGIDIAKRATFGNLSLALYDYYRDVEERVDVAQESISTDYYLHYEEEELTRNQQATIEAWRMTTMDRLRENWPKATNLNITLFYKPNSTARFMALMRILYDATLINRKVAGATGHG